MSLWFGADTQLSKSEVLVLNSNKASELLVRIFIKIY